MKYLILIYSNPKSRAVWEELSESQRVEFGRGHDAVMEALAASGKLVASEGLADPSLAKRVSVREGRTLTSDGPFAEVKEHLAGFYLGDRPRVPGPGGDRRPAHQPRQAADQGPRRRVRDAAREQYRLAARRTLSIPEQRYLESRASQLTAPRS